jgi:hypothetical protein
VVALLLLLLRQCTELGHRCFDLGQHGGSDGCKRGESALEGGRLGGSLELGDGLGCGRLERDSGLGSRLEELGESALEGGRLSGLGGGISLQETELSLAISRRRWRPWQQLVP